MLKAVYFAMDLKGPAPSLPSAVVRAEMERAAAALQTAGFRSGIIYLREENSRNRPDPGERTGNGLPLHGDPGEGTGRGLSLPAVLEKETGDALFLCGSGKVYHRLRDRGCCAAGYLHADNPGESFRGASYIIQEPDLVDPDSYIKIFEREKGLPWTILRTGRCLVREFTAEDLDGIYGLYDSCARRFLEPPSVDRARELEVLKAYIDRIYRLYGFGYWAVTAREIPAGQRGRDAKEPLPVRPGTLIGRVGFAMFTSEMEQEAALLGIEEADADFGFLISAACRGTGAAEEVCAAVLEYGFKELGFLKVRADSHKENAASLRLLKKLGFKPVGEQGDRIIFLARSE